ncbi:NAD(P)-binding domain-containing protein [Micromonospora arida]|uniref:NAD(P)-binding domain-containing protein n=1 Tax=Micromonospora arida TaxID=2203715 RepID=UPI0033DA06F1
MRIAVLGTGSVGRAIAARTAELGHQVTIGTRDVAAIRAGDHAHWAAQHPEVGLATLAEAASGAKLVVRPHQLAEGAHSVFVSGDDAEAKRIVSGLLVSFGHTDVIDLGDLSTARGTEMLLPLWLRLYGRLDTANFNIKVVR